MRGAVLSAALDAAGAARNREAKSQLRLLHLTVRVTAAITGGPTGSKVTLAVGANVTLHVTLVGADCDAAGLEVVRIDSVASPVSRRHVEGTVNSLFATCAHLVPVYLSKSKENST